jgi:hypothetical protein
MPNPPTYAADIIFGPQGLGHVATAQQLDRIRTEEPIIVLRTFAAYPSASLDAFVGNALRQLSRFGLGDLMVDQRLSVDPAMKVTIVADDPAMVLVRDRFSLLCSIVVWLAICAFPVAFWRMREARGLLSLIAVGLVANAFVCGMLSAVADRYQARVVWLLPLIMCALLVRLLSQRTSKEGTGVVANASRDRESGR